MRKQIWMGSALQELDAECGKAKGREGKFSSRLDEIVERYRTLMRLTQAPPIEANELALLGRVMHRRLSPSMLRCLPDEILESGYGTEEERRDLAEKVRTWSYLDIIAIIEKYDD